MGHLAPKNHYRAHRTSWWVEDPRYNVPQLADFYLAAVDDQAQIRKARLKLYFSHAQLVSASIYLQHALDIERIDPTMKPFALAKYQTASIALLRTFLEYVFPLPAFDAID